MPTPTVPTGVGGLSTKVRLVSHDFLHLLDAVDECRKCHNLLRRNPRPQFLLHFMELRPHPCDFVVIHARTNIAQVLDNVGMMRPRLHHEEAENPDARTHRCMVATNTSIAIIIEPPGNELILLLEYKQDLSPLLCGPRPIPTTIDFADKLVEREWRYLLGHRLPLASGRNKNLFANIEGPVLIIAQASKIGLNAVCLQLTFLRGHPPEKPEASYLLVIVMMHLASGGFLPNTKEQAACRQSF